MKKVFLKIFAVCVCLCMMIPLFAACGQRSDKFVIGLSGPFSGDAKIYGLAVKNSAQMAVDEINAAGGLNGVQFELVTYDDVNDSSKIETGFSYLMEQGMQVSLGCVTSKPCLEFAGLAAENDVFFLTPSATADAVADADVAYQMCFADSNQGLKAAEYVNSLGLSKIGVFYKSDDPYSKGIFDQFKTKINANITIVEKAFDGDKTDFSGQIDAFVAAECDFIFMPIYYTPAQAFMTQAKGKIANNATYYGCDGFDGLVRPEGVTQKIEMLTHFTSEATTGKAKEFIDNYTAKYGQETLNQFGASAYDCVYAIFGAMKAAADAGQDLSPDMSAAELCAVLQGQFNGDYKYTGAVTGVEGAPISWDSTGYVNKEAFAYEIK